MVSHGAQECSVWLASKGSLPLDQQGFGAWLIADPFSVGKNGPAKGRRDHERR